MKKSEIEEKIFQLQVRALKSLQTGSDTLKKKIKDLDDKISDQGINGYYSVNSEILTYAMSIWKSSAKLSELKALQDELTGAGFELSESDNLTEEIHNTLHEMGLDTDEAEQAYKVPL